MPTPPATGSTSTLSSFVNGLSGIVGDNTVSALIRALATDSRAKILSAPSVLATDNRPARIQVGTEEPIATGSVSSAFGTANNTVSNSIQYRNTGRIMTIIPQVNSQGLVNLQIKAEVSARGDDVTVGDQKFPSFNTQDAETSAVVNDGETLVIGGLIGEIKTKGRTGLPYLMDLPVVGRFFGATSETSTKTELIMLITPRVIRNREEAREVTAEFKNKLNTVRNELEKFRADQERDQQRQRLLRQPLPPAPATQIPQEDIPIQPAPPTLPPVQPNAVPVPPQSQVPLSPAGQLLPMKQPSAAAPPVTPQSGASRGLIQSQEPAVPQAAAQPPAPTPVAPAATMVANVVESDNPDAPGVASDMAANDPIERVLNDIESRGMSDANKPVSQLQNVRPASVWVVQVASYVREADALSYASTLKSKGYDANVAQTDIGGKTRYRVEVGPLASRNEALALQKTLRSTQRIEDSLVLSKLPAPAGDNR